MSERQPKLADAPCGDATDIGDQPDKSNNAEKPEPSVPASNPAPEPPVDSKPDPAPAPAERGRLLFVAVDLWPALCNPRIWHAVWKALGAAAATAAGQPECSTCCFVCRAVWTDQLAPDAVILAEPVTITDDACGQVGLICRICWPGHIDERLRAALCREFGMQPAELRPVHAGGRA
jgi:hypothetical protein